MFFKRWFFLLLLLHAESQWHLWSSESCVVSLLSDLTGLESSVCPRGPAPQGSCSSPFLSCLYTPNSWIVSFHCLFSFFQQCGHLACLTVLTCQVKKQTFHTWRWFVWFLWNTLHSSACSNMPEKKIERLSSNLWSAGHSACVKTADLRESELQHVPVSSYAEAMRPCSGQGTELGRHPAGGCHSFQPWP